MHLMPLPPADQTRLQNAVKDSSRESIKSTLEDLKVSFALKEWLGARNRYVHDPFQRIRADTNGAKPLSHNQLREYICASSILHCKDGWEYFSNAVASVLKGDIPNSVHFAYYAELRAAMSFLAGDGIGVFNGYNIQVRNNGQCHKIGIQDRYGKRTHAFVWYAITALANEPTKSNQILNIIDVAGKSINRWLEEAQMLTGSPAAGILTSTWLKQWSLDLNIVNQDHDFRNRVSYSPQGIKHSRRYIAQVKQELDFIVSKWQLTTPSVQEKFQILDYYLLREALEEFYRIKYIQSNARSKPTYRKYYTDIMVNLGLTVSSNQRLLDFLLRRSYKTLSPVLNHARMGHTNEKGVYRPLGIIARAYLLLRLATASVHDLMVECGITSYDLEFWWKEIGLDRGYWNAGSEPIQFADLWSDVAASISDYDQFKNNNQSFDLKQIHDYSRINSHKFNQFHRAYLWGIWP